LLFDLPWYLLIFV